MSKLPIISYTKLRNKIKKLWYIEIRTSKHPVYYNALNWVTLPIPFHDWDVPKWTLRAIINELWITVEEFIKIK